MPIGIRFQLRPRKCGRLATLVCRITVNAKEGPGFVVSDGQNQAMVFRLSGKEREWDQRQQRPVSRDHPAHFLLAQLEADLWAIYNRQQDTATTPPPTHQSVKWAYSNGRDPWVNGDAWEYAPPVRQRINADTLLSSALGQHITDLPGDLSPITLRRWSRTLRYLTEFLGQQPGPTISTVRIKWAKSFHLAMQERAPDKKGRKPSADEASRHLRRIGELLTDLYEEEVIDRNPLAGVSWPKAKGKPVYYLEPEQMASLDRLPNLSRTKQFARWWFRFMAYSGLDYPDAKLLLADPGAYIQQGVAGQKIVMTRLKPPHNSFDVPIRAELAAMLAQTPPPELTPQCINDWLKDLGQEIGFPYPLTIKIARKTAGAYFLQAGYRIEEVSRILGHRSIVTTERYYVRVLGSLVDRGTIRVGQTKN